MASTVGTFLRRCGSAGRLAKFAAAAVLANMAATAAAETWYFKVKNECSVPLTLYARVKLPWAGWTTVGPIQFMAGERKYLSRGGKDLTSDNRHFYLFAHVQGNPDVVVLRGQRSDSNDRDLNVFGRTRRFEHFREERRLQATDAWIDCEQMVFDGVPQRRRPARGPAQSPRELKRKLPPRAATAAR